MRNENVRRCYQKRHTPPQYAYNTFNFMFRNGQNILIGLHTLSCTFPVTLSVHELGRCMNSERKFASRISYNQKCIDVNRGRCILRAAAHKQLAVAAYI
jgi:hypothetical protein